MAGFYAIILDRDYGAGGTFLDLIDSGSTLDTLRTTQDYDPNTDCTRILRNRFTATQVEDHPVVNLVSKRKNKAHICRVEAI